MVKQVKRHIENFSDTLENVFRNRLATLLISGLFSLIALGFWNAWGMYNMKRDDVQFKKEIYNLIEDKCNNTDFWSHWHFGDRQEVTVLNLKSRGGDVVPGFLFGKQTNGDGGSNK